MANTNCMYKNNNVVLWCCPMWGRSIITPIVSLDGRPAEFFDPSPCFVSPQLSVTLRLSRLALSFTAKTAQIKTLFMCVRQRKSRELVCVTSVIPVLLNVFNRAPVCV